MAMRGERGQEDQRTRGIASGASQNHLVDQSNVHQKKQGAATTLRHQGRPRLHRVSFSSRLVAALPRILQEASTPEYATAAVVHLRSLLVHEGAAWRRGKIKWSAGPSDN
jgi:hypothetical protein